MFLKIPLIMATGVLMSCHTNSSSSKYYKNILNDIEAREVHNQLHLDKPLALKYYESMKLCLARMSTSQKKNLEDLNHLLWMSTKVDEPTIALIAIQQGANINHNYMSRHNGMLTPLMEAVSSDSIKTAEILINKGADIHIKDKEGRDLSNLAYSKEMLNLLRSHYIKPVQN